LKKKCLVQCNLNEFIIVIQKHEMTIHIAFRKYLCTLLMIFCLIDQFQLQLFNFVTSKVLSAFFLFLTISKALNLFLIKIIKNKPINYL